MMGCSFAPFDALFANASNAASVSARAGSSKAAVAKALCGVSAESHYHNSHKRLCTGNSADLQVQPTHGRVQARIAWLTHCDFAETLCCSFVILD